MRISSITPTSVWGASSRSLTNIGSGALAPFTTVFTSIAASGSVDLRSSAGIMGQILVGAQTGATATTATVIQIWDGTHSFNVASSAAAANSFVGFFGGTANGVGMRIVNNDAAVACSYMASGLNWTQ